MFILAYISLYFVCDVFLEACLGFLFLFNLSHMDLSLVESWVSPCKVVSGEDGDSRIFGIWRGDSLPFSLPTPCFPFCFAFYHVHRHFSPLQPVLAGSFLMAPRAGVGWSEPGSLWVVGVEAKYNMWNRFINGTVFQQVGCYYLKHCYGMWLILHKAAPPCGLVLSSVLSSSCPTTHSRFPSSHCDVHWDLMALFPHLCLSLLFIMAYLLFSEPS